MKKNKGKADLGAKLLQRLDKDRVPRGSAEFLVGRLFRRMYVNVEISSRSVNCQLYQIKETKDDFRCRFQTNSAEKKT